MRALLIAALTVATALPLAAQQPRLASDFEIAQMEKQLEFTNDFEALFSARINLGDARESRNETSLARAEFSRALVLAEDERREARKESEPERYATATAMAATAHVRLGNEPAAFTLLEEAIRYVPDNPYVWNSYASAMRLLRHPGKAIAAGRNAVAVAEHKSRKIDQAVFRYSLASSLLDAKQDAEAEELLRGIVQLLRSREFDSLRKEVARREAFEVHTFVRGEVAAYVSLMNRAQLQLATMYENRGDLEAAREQYRAVLEARSDDVIALSALARLARSAQEREQRYAEAFAANPFSMELVRDYQRHLMLHPATGGSGLQLALQQLARGDRRGARATLDQLLQKFPHNETLHTLRSEVAESSEVSLPSPEPTAFELRMLLDGFERLTPEQRVTLDRTEYTSMVQFEGDVFHYGTIAGVAFRFAAAVEFQGLFDIANPLRLTYRILGVTRANGQDSLLLEPVRLEAAP